MNEIIKKNYPYPIKDWTNKGNYLRETPSLSYVEPTKMDLNFWKWEFLRRNAEYQELYASFEQSRQDRSKPIVGNLKDFGLFFYINPLNDRGYQSMPPLCNIHKLPNFEDNQKYKLEYKNYTDEIALHSLLMQIEQVQQKGGVFVSLDLNLPLEIQFDKIKKILKDKNLINIRKTIKQVRPKEWIEYLRILDAYADKVEIDVIASVIYSDKPNIYPDYLARDTVRKAYKTASELMINFAIGGQRLDTNGVVSY